MTDGQRGAPRPNDTTAAARNVRPIGDAIAGLLPSRGRVLELACGRGEHAMAYARRFPHLEWLPTDGDPSAVAALNDARRTPGGPANLLPAMHLDIERCPRHLQPVHALVAINLLHIAPWSTTLALMSEAQRLLPLGGVLCIYGAFKEDGRHTGPSNAAFDEELRSRNDAWGVRDIADVEAVARLRGLGLQRRAAMPANNRLLVLRKRSHSQLLGPKPRSP